MTNACHKVECPDLCCFGTSFRFTKKQYSLWCQLAGYPEMEELTVEEFRTLAPLFGIGRQAIFHAILETVEGKLDFVQLNRVWCPLHNEGDDGGCSAWGKFNGCNNFAAGEHECNRVRANAGLPQI